MNYSYIVKCLSCGRKIARANNYKFKCSICKGNSYSREFKMLSKILRENNVCRICGDNKNLAVHHIDKNIRNNRLSNLEVRCKQCHISKHGTKEKKHIGIRWGMFGKRLIYD
jgi:predicted RNA-binding Zn-ribbon protein involved in translation (DUF1610 family)